MLKRSCFLLSALIAGGTTAQTVARPDPADPKATSAAIQYESAYKGFRPYADADIARWRDSNQEVGHLGGHRGHVQRPTRGPAGTGEKPGVQREQGDRK